MNDFSRTPPIWRFGLFAVVLLVLSAIPATSKFALAIALVVLALQLLAMNKKGHSL